MVAAAAFETRITAAAMLRSLLMGMTLREADEAAAALGLTLLDLLDADANVGAAQ